MAKQVIMKFDVGGVMHVDVDGVKGGECKEMTEGLLASFASSDTTDANDKPDLYEDATVGETAQRW